MGTRNHVLDEGVHWRHLANTVNRYVRRRCDLLLPLLKRLASILIYNDCGINSTWSLQEYCSLHSKSQSLLVSSRSSTSMQMTQMMATHETASSSKWHPGSPVAVRAGASLLGRRLPSRVRQHSALSAVNWRLDLRGAANTQQLWQHNVAAAGPRLWNSLPGQLRNPDITYGLFRRQLKGYLFREAWTRRSVTSDMRLHRKNTYLLTSLELRRLTCATVYGPVSRNLGRRWRPAWWSCVTALYSTR